MRTTVEMFLKTPNAFLICSNGKIFQGYSVGAPGIVMGELVFSTSMTGYQETLSDPSFAGQIITYCTPHIGNVGVNDWDNESFDPKGLGVIFCKSSLPSNWRSQGSFENFLKQHGLLGMCEVDTRSIVKMLCQEGSLTVLMACDQDLSLEELKNHFQEKISPDGIQMSGAVTNVAYGGCTVAPFPLGQQVGRQGPQQFRECPYEWTEGLWREASLPGVWNVVVMDFGVKHSILRNLVHVGFRVYVVPFSASYDEIKAYNPQGILLSNGPGDPQVVYEAVASVLKQLLDSSWAIFGICLGHQLLAIATGAKTYKMKKGHRGVNQPVKNIENKKVEITTQNHGFAVDRKTLPPGVEESHISLFDGVLEGLSLDQGRIFSVQYHPEASPGPQDSRYLFQKFFHFVSSMH